MVKEHKFFVGKLIRDKVPDLMRSMDIESSERVMEMDEYIEKLKDKLFEEAKEVLDASDRKEFLIELADVIEVIYALAATANSTPQDIEKIRQDKRSKKGGFEGRIFNSQLIVRSDNPEIKYLLADADRYPEIK